VPEDRGREDAGAASPGSCLGSQGSCPGSPQSTPTSLSILQSLVAAAGLVLGSVPDYGVTPQSAVSANLGFESAKQAWLSAPAVDGSYQQHVPILRAIKDLTRGLSTDQNTAGYAVAIGHLRNLTTIPDAMVTPAEEAEATADEKALDTFFGTPNLFTS
jgi:hypothetical protein